MSLIRTCLIFIIVVFVNSCTKSDSPTVTGTRLQKIAIKQYDSLGFIFFKYDQDNRLTKLIVSHDKYGIDGRTTMLTYDLAGRVSSFKHFFAHDPYSSSDTLEYFNNGANLKITGSSRIGGPHIYAFDAKHRLISDSAMDSDTAHAYATFRYDANDNLVEWNVYQYLFWTKSWGHFGNNFLTYDNRKSPFSDLGQLLYLITGTYEWLGKNNITQTEFWYTDPTVYTYEFTSNGLPKKVIRTQDNHVVFTHEYFYD